MQLDMQKFIAGIHDYFSRALSPLVARVKVLEEKPDSSDEFVREMGNAYKDE